MAEGGSVFSEEFNEDDDEEFQDAFEVLPEPSALNLHASIEDAMAAMNLFLNNGFDEAKTHFKKLADRSMYHALGYGTVMFLQATMTFDAADIDSAYEVVKHSTSICNRHRRKSGFMDSLYKQKTYYDDLTKEQVHAELCYAECLLERALLTFIQDENLINFIKGSLRIKSCYNSYKECVQILSRRNWKIDDEKVHFESGVCLGVGSFNLMISLMPTRMMKLLEFVGFSGNMRKGLLLLEKGAQFHSMRGPLCSFALLAYHVIITYVMGTGEGDVKFASDLIEKLLVRYPKGAITLFYLARLNEVAGNINNAVVRFEESIDSQKLWLQLHHLCYWELMFCHCFKGDWLLAMKYAEKLLAESRWSKATYAYQKAAFLLMCDEQSENTKSHVVQLLQEVPKLKQRIAGKSVPIEKFAVRKSELFFEQSKRLTLPGYELIYIWNGFLILSKSPELLDPILLKAEATLQEMALQKGKFIHFADDYSLAMLIKAVCLRHKGEKQQAEECFLSIIQNYKDVQVDKYLIPSALYELALLYISADRLDEAEEALNRARSDHCVQALTIQFSSVQFICMCVCDPLGEKVP